MARPVFSYSISIVSTDVVVGYSERPNMAALFKLPWARVRSTSLSCCWSGVATF